MNAIKPNGELIPEGGGDNIPLIRDVLTIGRRDSCDICLRLPNVSGLHCELSFQDGCWWIKDMGSTNGVKVNGVRVPKKLLLSGERITIAKKTYTIEYDAPAGARAEGTEDATGGEDIMGQSLLERAGLAKPRAADGRKPGKASKIVPDSFPEDEEDDLGESKRITL